jgi:acyl-CoA synthetase (AMP-forming)/AMP-acid ligase II
VSALNASDLWRRVAEYENGIRFIGTDTDPRSSDDGVFIRHRDLLRAAAATARVLEGAGIRTKERVLISARTCPEFAIAWFALMLMGAVPVPVPPCEVFVGKDVLAERVRPLLPYHRFFIADQSDVDELAGVSDIGELRMLVLSEIAKVGSSSPLDGFPEPAPDDEAFIQYTSGSTSRPKGIVITYGNILANVDGIRDALEVTSPDDVYISWLPLYHDMGLVGKLLNPVINGNSLILVPPQYFARRPLRFLKLLARYHAQYCAMPNFALEWILRADAAKPEPVDLSSLRWLGIGSEPVSCDALARFSERFREQGLGPNVLSPCYGLAEATLAVTISRPSRPFQATRHEGRQVPGNGPLVLHVEAKLAEDTAHVLVRGDSIAKHAYVDGEKVRIVDENGFYDTKDLGFFDADELVILGRADEMFIVNGANHFPYDLESVARAMPGSRVTRAACFQAKSASGTEVVLLIEARHNPQAHAGLEDAVRQHVFEHTGLRIERVVVVPQKTIPLTTSGKLRRRAARGLYEAGSIQTTVENVA